MSLYGFIFFSRSRIYDSVGIKCWLKSTSKISLKDKPVNSWMDTLPANDSLMPFINSNFWEPDKINNPLSSVSSTIIFISSSILPSFWTSSIKRGHGLFKKKSFGSSFACSLVNLSSKFALWYSGKLCFTNVDFPTCLAPTINVHLLEAMRFFIIDVIALSIYGIKSSRLI